MGCGKHVCACVAGGDGVFGEHDMMDEHSHDLCQDLMILSESHSS